VTGLPPARRLPLFVYGTLVEVAFAANMLGREPAYEPARLLDFERLELEGLPYPAVSETQGETVEGLVYRGLVPEEIERLDAYEGVAEGLYRRIVAHVVAGEPGDPGTPEPAFVYVATEKTLRRYGVR